MRLFLSFYTLLVSFGGNLHASDPCAEFGRSTSIQTVISHLSEIALINPPLWANCNPKENSYLLLSSDRSSRCSVLYSQRAIKEVRLLNEHLNINNGFFDWYVKSKHPINAEVDGFLSKFAIDVATVIYVDYDIGFSLEEQEAYGLEHVVPNILVHEGFHITFQRSGKNWPNWTTSAGQDDVGQRCYFTSEEIFQTFRREAQALIAAAKLAAEGKNDSSLVSVREFLEQRIERRKLLSAAGADFLAWCEQNESALEMEEGVAHWLGYGAEMALGHIRIDQFVKYFEMELMTPDSFFYSFGCLQMYLLWKLKPVQFLDVTESLIKSLSWIDGIDAQIKALLQ